MDNEYIPWEKQALGILNKIFVTICLIVIFGTVLNYIIDYAGGKKPRKEQLGGNIWKNADPSRPSQDIKSYDYNNQTVTYREYRSGQSPTTVVPETKTYSWKEVEHRTVLYTYPNPSRKRNGVTVKDGKITVTVDLEKVLDNMSDYQKEQFLQDILDNADYNDLLDYYGSPELR